MPDAIVIGAGVGGLAAAIELAAADLRVVVLEAAERPGGKAGVVTIDGTEVDTGPSVLTLPHVFAELAARAGTRLEDELTLRRPSPAFRYLYPDGVALDVEVAPEATLESVARTLGRDARDELAAFLRYAARVWGAAAPPFVYGEAPSIGRLAAAGPRALAALARINPLRTMRSAIHARVRSPHLRALLMRYATYNGSDARRAPATLNCIAHVELVLGGFGVEGGMYTLVRALTRWLARLGGELRLKSSVLRIERDRDGAACGVELATGERVRAPIVVCNAEPRALFGSLLCATPRGEARAKRVAVLGPARPSLSGYTAILRAARRPAGAGARVAHTVLFPHDYDAEFEDLFDRDAPAREPSVYLCASEACHGTRGWPAHEPLFLMANAPAEPAEGARDEAAWPALRERVLARLYAFGLAEPSDALLWERTPGELARAFPASRGALYGDASNDARAAFQRPGNAVAEVPGLFIASGAAHPGGGLPLAALSGRTAARAALRMHAAQHSARRHPHG